MKRILRFLALGLCLVISSSLLAQEEGNNSPTEAIVYLKNGSKIKGEIIEWQIGEYIILQMPWDSQVTLLNDQISKVIQSGTSVNLQPEYNFREKGIYFTAKTQVITGNKGNRAHGVFGYGFSASAGHRFHRLLGVGGGIGFDQYIWDSGEQFIPVFAEVNGFFMPKLTSLFYNIQLGYSFSQVDTELLLNDSSGGLMVYPSLGLRFGKESTKITIDVGYKFQNASFTYRDTWTATTSSEQDVLFKRLCLRFGISL